MNSMPSFRNWLVLILLGLALLGVLFLTIRHQPATETASQSPLSSPLVYLRSPLITPTQEPLPAHLMVPSPVPTASPMALSDQPSALALTVLHTNDTWGYLRPCG